MLTVTSRLLFSTLERRVEVETADGITVLDFWSSVQWDTQPQRLNGVLPPQPAHTCARAHDESVHFMS